MIVSILDPILPRPILDIETVDILFLTFLAPFVAYVLVKRVSAWGRRRNSTLFSAFTMFGLTASGFVLWVSQL